ncbi:Flp pilus assembly protein TadG [Arthrobacter globiformis]|nr:Flp pilus assembly protein TadG [Arthrobacter globiformis]
MYRESERGAAAVEFALLVPILIVLVFGIMEFGRAYSVQMSLANAAREGARSMAITKNQDTARTAAKNAALHLSPALENGNITFSLTAGTSGCPTNAQTTVNISYNLSTMTGIVGPFTMTGRGTMLCGG